GGQAEAGGDDPGEGEHAGQREQQDHDGRERDAPEEPGARAAMDAEAAAPRRPRLTGGPPRRRAATAGIARHASANLYPTPYTVSTYRGLRGSGSSFRRRFLTCASIARSNDSTCAPRMASSSWPRVKTRPGCRI